MWPTVFDLKLPFWPHEFSIRSYGLMLMIGFLGGTWWAARRADRVKANPELIVNMGFVALLASIVGARAFYVIHYWDESFAGRGLWAIINITAGGLEFYGGFLGGFAALILYLWYSRVSLRLYFDIIAPSLAFGLAVTRIGCFLNGCCWGGPCPEHFPWAVKFPYLSNPSQRQWADRVKPLPAELIYVNPSGVGRYSLSPTGKVIQGSSAAYPIDPSRTSDPGIQQQAVKFGLRMDDLVAMSKSPEQRSVSLHPVQLYSSIDAGLLALLLSTTFYRRKRHGVLVSMFLILYPIMRILEETIRIDNPHDTANLTISQFVSVVLLVIGVSYTWVLYRRLPLRSPKAVPYVPRWLREEEEARQEPTGKVAKGQPRKTAR